MKKFNNKFLALPAAIAVMGLASCSNELNDAGLGNNNPSVSVNGVSLVKAPDVVAWSGSQTIGSTLSGGVAPYGIQTRSDAQPIITKWQSDTKIEGWPETTDRGEQVSTAEKNYVIAYLAEHPDEGYKKVDLTTYFLQNVGGSYDVYHEGFMNGDNAHHYADITGSNQMDYLVINGIHINDYNANNGPRVHVANLPLENNTYHDSYANLTPADKFRFYYIPNQDGEGYGLYLCFDYSTNKYDNGQLDFAGDGVYNDWVIKIIPGDGSPVVPPSEQNGDTPGGGDGNNNGNGDNGDNNDNTVDVTPLPVEHNHEVEVNYAILDDHGYESGIEDLVTKLSIHVRYATDVDIKIPIPTRYIIESDDLYIFNEHYTKPDGEYEGAYGGESYSENPLANQNATLSYPITNADGREIGNVILHVDFERGDENLGDAFADGYIHVWTEGITDAVIKACWEYNKDGINFEIFNYFQTEKVVWNEEDEFEGVETPGKLNRRALLEAMNQSVISFDFQPDYYINAFGFAYEDGEKTDGIHLAHATVTPTADQGYEEPYRRDHLNSTPYNDIYVLNGKEADHLHEKQE